MTLKRYTPEINSEIPNDVYEDYDGDFVKFKDHDTAITHLTNTILKLQKDIEEQTAYYESKIEEGRADGYALGHEAGYGSAMEYMLS